MAEVDWAALAEMADEEGKPLDEGDYVFIVGGGKMSPSKKGAGHGSNILLNLRVADGPKAGKTALMNIFVPGSAYEGKGGVYTMLAGRLNSIGVPLQALASMGTSAEQVGAMFKDKTFIGSVTHRPWNGRVMMDIDNVRPIGSAMQTALPSVASQTSSAVASSAPKAPF